MNPSLYHKFLDISVIPAGLNPIEANKPSVFPPRRARNVKKGSKGVTYWIKHFNILDSQIQWSSNETWSFSG
jgi:hypothetical protein